MSDHLNVGPGDGVDGEIATAIADAMDLIGAGSYDIAWGLLASLLVKANEAGLASGFLHWALALAAHGRRDLHTAMKHILEALKGDPAAPVFLDTYRAIVATIRNVLAAQEYEALAKPLDGERNVVALPSRRATMTAFNVYRLYPQQDGSIRRQLAGRFLESADEVHVLEDFFGVLSGLSEGKASPRARAILDSIRRASYLQVVPANDIDSA